MLLRVVNCVLGGHIHPNAFSVYSTKNEVFEFCCQRVVPSLKDKTYTTSFHFDFGAVDRANISEMMKSSIPHSFCECKKGLHTKDPTLICAHKLGLMVYFGLLAEMILNGFDDEEILSRIPVEILGVQCRPMLAVKSQAEFKKKRFVCQRSE